MAASDGFSMMERLERTGSFLPKGVAYGVSDGRNGVRFVTFKDLKDARIAKQRQHLLYILETSKTRWAGFLWVFWTPGIGGFAYRGWWAYLRTLAGDTPIDFRGFDKDLAAQAMSLFPCGILPILDNFEQWKEAFARTYRRPGRFRKQGLTPIWVSSSPVNGRLFHLEYAQGKSLTEKG